MCSNVNPQHHVGSSLRLIVTFRTTLLATRFTFALLDRQSSCLPHGSAAAGRERTSLGGPLLRTLGQEEPREGRVRRTTKR